jgi:uncharacterized protein YbjT (DUF2867 family)
MKVVVIGGSGLIGSKLVTTLREQGHEALPASPRSGVNTLTGEGLAEALAGASVVVDVSNAPSWEDDAVLAFFETSTRNLLAAAAAAGVGHHVVLSVVGTERLTESGYFRAKLAQESLVRESAVPDSIVRATQFFEFVPGIADAAMDGATVRLPPALFQPMAADDIAMALARVALGSAVNGIVEIAGPDQFRLDELIRERLSATGDPRTVVTDPQASYFGMMPGERTLLPGDDALLTATHYADWLNQTAPHP